MYQVFNKTIDSCVDKTKKLISIQKPKDNCRCLRYLGYFGFTFINENKDLISLYTISPDDYDPKMLDVFSKIFNSAVNKGKVSQKAREQYISLMKEIKLDSKACKSYILEKEYNYGKIDYKDILYYKVEGNLQYLSKVTGSGANTEAAIKGAALFGTAGAIIGSGIGTGVNTSVDTIDNRELKISYVKDGETVVRQVMSANEGGTFNTYQKIDDCIKTLGIYFPEKEYSMVALNKQCSASDADDPTVTANSLDDLKKLKEFLDSGIITQEEFDAKKKQILGV